MTRDELYDISFQLILHSGNARSCGMEALYEAKSKNFEVAKEKIEEARKELNEAHHFQTQLIQTEAGGEKYDIPIVLVHAQDHLMTAMVVVDMAEEFVELRQELQK